MEPYVIDADNMQKWDEVVTSFSGHTPYHLNGYAKSLQKHGDGQPVLLYYEYEDTRAINVVMKRDIAETAALKGKIDSNRWFDLITPYGYGGILVEGSKIDAIKKARQQYCDNENIVCEFARFLPTSDLRPCWEQLYQVSLCGHTIEIDLRDEATFVSNLKSENRTRIRKALKSGVEIFFSNDFELIPSFMALYDKTMERDGASLYYYFQEEYYRTLFSGLKNSVRVFYAKLEGAIIAAAIILCDNHGLHYHLSGSEEQYKHLSPTSLILYEVCRWGLANGYTSLHLGGGKKGNMDGLYRYKKTFNAQGERKFYIGKQIYNMRAYEQLVDFRKENAKFDLGTSFFPLYRG